MIKWVNIMRTKNESKSKSNYFGAVHYDTFDELDLSASEGCNLCALFSCIIKLGQKRKNLPGYPGHLKPAGFIEFTEFLNDDKEVAGDIDTWQIRLHVISTENDQDNFIKGADVEPLVAFTRHNPSKSQPTDSPLVLEAHLSQLNSEPVVEPYLLPSHWLEECCFEHEACKNNEQLKAPTRLIKIDNGVVRLCLSAELESLPRYATLSHCCKYAV
jgi:hypothetical protein